MKIKDALLALDEASQFGTLWATVDRSRQTVNIHYTIPDPMCVFTGTIKFYNRSSVDFASRILAAGSAMAGVCQSDAGRAEALIHSKIRPHALKILTTPCAWELCGHTKNVVTG